jgi:CDP-diacylglycerol--serine O-phosphatidyltransferase
VVYSWALQHMPRCGWTICLFFVLCAALRLARFNARIDADEQPHKSAGFNTGVPSPAGAGLMLLPLTVWLETGAEWARDYRLIGPWVLLIAVLMISNVATYSWSSIRIRPAFRFLALAGVGLFVAALISAPWVALIVASLVYIGLIPLSVISYAKVKRARRAAAQAA